MQRYMRKTWEAHRRPVKPLVVDVDLVARALGSTVPELLAQFADGLGELIAKGVIEAGVRNYAAEVRTSDVFGVAKEAVARVPIAVVRSKPLRPLRPICKRCRK